MSKSIPARLNLEQLRKQAKDLLKAHARGSTEVASRLISRIPRLAQLSGSDLFDSVISLREAQHVIAGENGFDGWTQLVSTVKDVNSLIDTTPAYQISSKLPLQVGWIDIDGGNDPCSGGEHKLGGTTIGGRIVSVPESRMWYIEPRAIRGISDWNEIFEEVVEKKIPGLSAGNKMIDQSLEGVGKLDHLKYLDLSMCSGISDEGIKHIAKLTNLKWLRLGRCYKITDEGLSVLEHLPNLNVVSFPYQATDRGVSFLKNHSNLHVVNLADTQTGDGALEHLAGKPTLSHLSLGIRITDDGLALLKNFPGLANWTDNRPSYKSNEYHGPSPSSLTIPLAGGIQVKDVKNGNMAYKEGTKITDAGMAHLRELQGVFELLTGHFRQTDNRITSKSAVAVAQMRNVRSLIWGERLCDDFALQHISKMPNL